MRLRFHPDARVEYVEALLYLGDRRLGYGQKFEAEVLAALQRASEFRDHMVVAANVVGYVAAVTTKPLVAGLGIGVAIALLTACTMTLIDWRINPDGLFHDARGTHWRIVWETASSWFVPVALAASGLAVPAAYGIHRWRRGQALERV